MLPIAQAAFAQATPTAKTLAPKVAKAEKAIRSLQGRAATLQVRTATTEAAIAAMSNATTAANAGTAPSAARLAERTLVLESTTNALPVSIASVQTAAVASAKTYTDGQAAGVALRLDDLDGGLAIKASIASVNAKANQTGLSALVAVVTSPTGGLVSKASVTEVNRVDIARQNPEDLSNAMFKNSSWLSGKSLVKVAQDSADLLENPTYGLKNRVETLESVKADKVAVDSKIGTFPANYTSLGAYVGAINNSAFNGRNPTTPSQ